MLRPKGRVYLHNTHHTNPTTNLYHYTPSSDDTSDAEHSRKAQYRADHVGAGKRRETSVDDVVNERDRQRQLARLQ